MYLSCVLRFTTSSDVVILFLCSQKYFRKAWFWHELASPTFPSIQGSWIETPSSSTSPETRTSFMSLCNDKATLATWELLIWDMYCLLQVTPNSLYCHLSVASDTNWQVNVLATHLQSKSTADPWARCTLSTRKYFTTNYFSTAFITTAVKPFVPLFERLKRQWTCPEDWKCFQKCCACWHHSFMPSTLFVIAVFNAFGRVGSLIISAAHVCGSGHYRSSFESSCAAMCWFFCHPGFFGVKNFTILL